MTYIIQLLIFLIEFSKENPERVRFPCGLHWINSLDCLSVCVDDLKKIGLFISNSLHEGSFFVWNVYIVTCALSQPFSKYLKPTCRGFPSYSFTRLCHSWTLWGFCLRSTLFNKRGRRAMSCSKRASLSSRSMSSEWRKTKSNVHMNKKNKTKTKTVIKINWCTHTHHPHPAPSQL